MKALHWPLLALTCALAACVSMQQQASVVPPPAIDAQVLVMLHAAAPHFRPGLGYDGGYNDAASRALRRSIASRIARDHGLRLLDDWPMPTLALDCFLMQTVPGAAADAARQLSGDPRVDWAQPVHRYRTLGDDDPLYAVQPAAQRWHLAKLQQLASGRGVTVAQIDTGVQLDHPDLRGQIAQAKNFVDDAPFPAETHGTEVAGIIAARAGNGIGIAGIAPRARLLALRACWQESAHGAECDSFTLAKALQYALLQRTRVLNLSLSGPYDRLLDQLLDAAAKQGIAVVAAVDEDDADGGFPASRADVFAVAAEERGARGNALLAPGQGIPTTVPGGGYALVDGSSFAAAQVSGLLALLRNLAPRLDPVQLRAALAGPAALGLAARRPLAIDACAAAARATGRCECGCETAGNERIAMPRR